ncbi:MAG TPA: alkaline phosphatase family protein [Chryseolinea sp.]
MSTCTKWVDQLVISCKNWSSKIDHECTTWADEGINQCDREEDQGYNACAREEDQGYKDCCDWWPCSWVCDAWTWISNIVCVAWTWISHVVCVAWHWVAKWVCKAFAWIVQAICVVFSWAFKLVCVAWDTIRCATLNLTKLLASLFSKEKRKPKIEHIFVLMLENRSFDHMLGFSGLTGVDIHGNPTTSNGVDATVQNNINPVTGNPVFVNPRADFQLANIDADPGHEFGHTLRSLCGETANYNPTPGGYPFINNSGFIQNALKSEQDYNADNSTTYNTPERIMNCFDSRQLPILNTLAKEFALCDNWFSSLPGPTWPNRFFLLAATSGGLDNSPSTLDIVSSTTVEGYRFENGNIFDLLDEHCIDWKIFEGDEFPVSFAMNGMNLNALQGRFKDFEDFQSELAEPGFKEKFVFIEPRYGAHNFDVLGPGDFTCGNSMHPLDDVIRGEKLIKKVYETIRNSPHWGSSLLIITFDEHGGFYDHVAPPAAVPPGDLITAGYRKDYEGGHPKAGQPINFQFDQLGVRVPALVISPFTRKGVIDHTTYDHTSMLATVERLFGMEHLTHRDKAANDFLHLFSSTLPRTDAPTTLPEAAVNPNPLPCDDDDETEDTLLLKRSELRIARKSGRYKDRRVDEFTPTSSQVGFAQVALLKILQTATYPERVEWIEQYKEIRTGVDAGIFMTEAKLKLKYAIDLKKAVNPLDRANLRTKDKGRGQEPGAGI